MFVKTIQLTNEYFLYTYRARVRDSLFVASTKLLVKHPAIIPGFLVTLMLRHNGYNGLVKHIIVPCTYRQTYGGW